MIRHVVSFKIAADDQETRTAHAAEAARRLVALLGVVPSLRTMTAGANVVALGQNWDLTLVADFDDEEGLQAYVVHPEHEKVAAYIGSIKSDRVAVDFAF